MGANFRDKFLTYNDDIQGTASVAMAALLGAVKLQKPNCTDLVAELRKMRVLFHGAGSANLGGASLIIQEGKMPRDQVIVTNSKPVVQFRPWSLERQITAGALSEQVLNLNASANFVLVIIARRLQLAFHLHNSDFELSPCSSSVIFWFRFFRVVCLGVFQAS